MTSRTITATTLLALTIAFTRETSPHATPSPSRGFAYSGTLRNNGVAASGTFDFAFDLVDGSGATVGCATDSRGGLAVASGRFDVTELFENCASLASALASGTPLAIRVTINGQQLTPDQALAPVPLALRAETASGLYSATPTISTSADVRGQFSWIQFLTAGVQIGGINALRADSPGLAFYGVNATTGAVTALDLGPSGVSVDGQRGAPIALLPGCPHCGALGSTAFPWLSLAVDHDLVVGSHPSALAGPAAGAGSSTSVDGGDRAGTITLVTGTTTTTGWVAEILYAHPFDPGPVPKAIQLTPANDAAIGAPVRPEITPGAEASWFRVIAKVPLPTGTALAWFYRVN